MRTRGREGTKSRTKVGRRIDYSDSVLSKLLKERCGKIYRERSMPTGASILETGDNFDTSSANGLILMIALVKFKQEQQTFCGLRRGFYLALKYFMKLL